LRGEGGDFFFETPFAFFGHWYAENRLVGLLVLMKNVRSVLHQHNLAMKTPAHDAQRDMKS
jgi:hypothetical protein